MIIKVKNVINTTLTREFARLIRRQSSSFFNYFSSTFNISSTKTFYSTAKIFTQKCFSLQVTPRFVTFFDPKFYPNKRGGEGATKLRQKERDQPRRGCGHVRRHVTLRNRHVTSITNQIITQLLIKYRTKIGITQSTQKAGSLHRIGPAD